MEVSMRQLIGILVLFLSMTGAMPPLWAQPVEKDTPRRIKLPAEVNRVVRAGRGDILLLQMNSLATVAVFDIKSEQITGYAAHGSDDALVAGTADHIILLARDKKVIQQWTLEPLEKALTVTLPLAEEIDGLAAGYASSGPVLIMTRQGPRFINLATLKLIDTEGDYGPFWRPHPQSPLNVAASADGSTFTGWALSTSPNGIRTLRLEGTKLTWKHEHSSAGELIPSADGTLLFTAMGVHDSNLALLDQGWQQGITFPAIHPAYYVGVTLGGYRGRPPGEGPPSVSIYSTMDRAMLLALDPLPGFSKVVPVARGGSLSPYERVIAHPTAKKMVIVDDNRTLLHILPLDLVKALNAKGIDYLFVESLPITTALAGKPYKYPVKVMSKAGNLKFTLNSGPKKMTISPDGVLSWNVPNHFDEKKIGIIVTVEDDSKQSIFHSFTINVMDPPKAP
jgi:hypothetical protein